MNDLVLAILEADRQVTIASLQGNVGAGGCFLALAADRVYARSGVVLNPHYKAMGNLYGSEYWTYLLPRRVGAQHAAAIVANRLPVTAAQAASIGLVDAAFDLSLLVRGTVPGGTVAAGEVKYAAIRAQAPAFTYYGRVVRDAGWAVCQYGRRTWSASRATSDATCRPRRRSRPRSPGGSSSRASPSGRWPWMTAASWPTRCSRRRPR